MQSSGTRSALLALGLIAAIGCVFLTAKLFGFLPDHRTQELSQRITLCESLAISGSELAARGDWEGMANTLRQAGALHPELRSAAVLNNEGQQRWSSTDEPPATGGSIETIDAPLFHAGQRWGVLRLSFARSRGGLADFIMNYGAPLFVAMMCFVIFTVVLRFILQRLSGSDDTPRSVQSSIDQLKESIVVLDHRERIVMANIAFCGLVGDNLTGLLGSKIAALPWRSQDGDLPWKTAMASGETVTGHTLRLILKRRTPRKLQTNCSPIRGKKGNIRGALLCMDDVTEFEQQMRDLQLARSTQHNEVMRAAVLRNVSRRLSGPAGSVFSTGQSLRRGLGGRGELLRNLYEHLVGSGRNLVLLQRDINDLQRLGGGRVTVSRRSCSPHAILADVYRQFVTRAEQKGLQLEFASTGALPMAINTDPERLERMLTHLVDNAIQYSRRGVIRVTASVEQVHDKHQLCVDVMDQGTGISSDLLPQIFQPFADLGDGRRGGLGLAVSKASAEVLGGSLSVASEVGHGSTFMLRVDTGPLKAVSNRPLRRHDLEPRRAESDRVVADRFRGKVLAADHDHYVRQLLSLLLESLGLEVTVVSNGREALRAARRDAFDLILLDTQLTGTDGVSATRMLRRQGFSNPIVALTDDPSEQEDCRQAGFTRMLMKPIQLEQLLFCLQRTMPQEDSAMLRKSTLALRPAARLASEERAAEAESSSQSEQDSPTESASKSESDPPTNWLEAPAKEDATMLLASPESDTQLPAVVHEQNIRVGLPLMKFLGEFEHRRVRLTELSVAREMKALQQEAQWLFGAATEVGLSSMAEAANNLTLMAQQGDPNGVELVLERMDALAERLVTPEGPPPMSQAAEREAAT